MTFLQRLYWDMYRIRKIEEEIAKRYPEQQMRCPVHLSIGQEAAAVGIASVLTPDDKMVSTHRGHAHYLAKGGSIRGLLCELYGKADGCSRGQGGSMHLVDRAVGFAGSTSIVGGTVPVGVGMAFAKKQKKQSGIVVVCIGDAAVEEGVFHEAANFASLHDLPVWFVCENNLYSCYTHIRERQPTHKRGFKEVAAGHGLEFWSLSGTDVWLLNEMLTQQRPKAPCFIQLDNYRYVEHCGPNNDDHLGYRSAGEIEFWKTQDPLRLCEERLHRRGEWSEEFIESLSLIHEEIRVEFEYATKAPFPEQSELGKYLYANSNGG